MFCCFVSKLQRHVRFVVADDTQRHNRSRSDSSSQARTYASRSNSRQSRSQSHARSQTHAHVHAESASASRSRSSSPTPAQTQTQPQQQPIHTQTQQPLHNINAQQQQQQQPFSFAAFNPPVPVSAQSTTSTQAQTGTQTQLPSPSASPSPSFASIAEFKSNSRESIFKTLTTKSRCNQVCCSQWWFAVFLCSFSRPILISCRLCPLRFCWSMFLLFYVREVSGVLLVVTSCCWFSFANVVPCFRSVSLFPPFVFACAVKELEINGTMTQQYIQSVLREFEKEVRCVVCQCDQMNQLACCLRRFSVFVWFVEGFHVQASF